METHKKNYVSVSLANCDRRTEHTPTPLQCCLQRKFTWVWIFMLILYQTWVSYSFWSWSAALLWVQISSYHFHFYCKCAVFSTTQTLCSSGHTAQMIRSNIIPTQQIRWFVVLWKNGCVIITPVVFQWNSCGVSSLDISYNKMEKGSLLHNRGCRRWSSKLQRTIHTPGGQKASLWWILKLGSHLYYFNNVTEPVWESATLSGDIVKHNKTIYKHSARLWLYSDLSQAPWPTTNTKMTHWFTADIGHWLHW